MTYMTLSAEDRKAYAKKVRNPVEASDLFVRLLELHMMGYPNMAQACEDLVDAIEKKYGIKYHPTTFRKHIEGPHRQPRVDTYLAVVGVLLGEG